jgi:hypothetical protein
MNLNFEENLDEIREILSDEENPDRYSEGVPWYKRGEK